VFPFLLEINLFVEQLPPPLFYMVLDLGFLTVKRVHWASQMVYQSPKLLEKRGVVTSVETLTIGIKSSDQEVRKGGDQAQQKFTGLLWVTIKNQGLYKSQSRQ